MKTILVRCWVLFGVLGLAAEALAQRPAPPPASQTEVNAGTDTYKYVTPAGLAGYSLLQSTSSISALTATNIAEYAAQTRDLAMSNILSTRLDGTNTALRAAWALADNVVSNALSGRLIATNANLQPLDSDLTALAGLGDPGADRLLFWDDSASSMAYLTLGTGLAISGTTITASAGTGGTGMQNPATADFDVANYSLLNVDTIYGNDGAHGADLSLHSYDSDATIKLYTFDSGLGIRYASQNGHTFTGPVTFNDGVTSGGAWSIATLNVTSSLTGNGAGITNINSSYVNYPTNSGAAVSPNMLVAYALLSTNAAFAMLPPSNVDIYQTNVQTSVTLVTNSTAAAVPITVPSPIKPSGVAYVTNVTAVSTTVYPKVVTNMVFLPIF